MDSPSEKLAETVEVVGFAIAEALRELAEAFDRNTAALERSNELAEGDNGGRGIVTMDA